MLSPEKPTEDEAHPEQGGDALRVTPSEESRRSVLRRAKREEVKKEKKAEELRLTTQMRWMTSAARRSLERKEAEELEHIQIASLTETEKRLSGDRGPQDWRRAPVTRKTEDTEEMRNRKPNRPFAEPCHRRIRNPDGGKLVEEKICPSTPRRKRTLHEEETDETDTININGEKYIIIKDEADLLRNWQAEAELQKAAKEPGNS